MIHYQLSQRLAINQVDAFDGGNDLIIKNKLQKEIMMDQIYMDKSTLKDVMEKYSIENRFKLLVERSNSIRIRVFNSEHTCPLKDGVHSDCRATSGLIGGIIAPKLRNHKRKYTLNDIRDNVRLDLGIDINYVLAWRAKEKALKSIMGQPAASYGKLPGYLYTLDKTYPGSHIQMKKTLENEFLYTPTTLNQYILEHSYQPALWMEQGIYYLWHTELLIKKMMFLGHGSLNNSKKLMLMKGVEQFDVRVKNYLELVEYEKWARLYAPVSRDWVMTSNIAECINSTLVAAKELPIFDFLEQ
ncbi:hypothetical protein H5410_007983, partial [Solanum commersonii]